MRKLSEKDKKYIKASLNSDKYLAWQFGVGIETIKKIRTDKKRAEPSKQNKKDAETKEPEGAGKPDKP